MVISLPRLEIVAKGVMKGGVYHAAAHIPREIPPRFRTGIRFRSSMTLFAKTSSENKIFKGTLYRRVLPANLID